MFGREIRNDDDLEKDFQERKDALMKEVRKEFNKITIQFYKIFGFIGFIGLIALLLIKIFFTLKTL